MSSGYQHLAYSAAMMHVGTPVALPGAGGWLLRRMVNGIQATDLVGPYPILACADWGALPDDLASLQGDALSVVCGRRPVWQP